MNEKDLLGLWGAARKHIIVSQLAPTFLLTVTIRTLGSGSRSVGIGTLSLGFFGEPVSTRIAAAGILLASGILGSIAQYTAASEAQAIAADLRLIGSPSAVARQIIRTAWWTTIVKFVTPAIFVVIYLAILWDLFIAN